MELGKPWAGKPPARFDEGSEARAAAQPKCLPPPTLLAYSIRRQYMRLPSIIITFGVAALSWVTFRSSVGAENAPNPEKRTVPPTVFLSFPPNVQIESVYIYPSSIAFRPRSGLKPHAKVSAELWKPHGKPAYNRTIPCRYVADDNTFWITPPEDIPSEVAINFRPQR